MKEYIKPLLTVYELTETDVITASASVGDDEKDHIKDPYGSDWFN